MKDLADFMKQIKSDRYNIERPSCLLERMPTETKEGHERACRSFEKAMVEKGCVLA